MGGIKCSNRVVLVMVALIFLTGSATAKSLDAYPALLSSLHLRGINKTLKIIAHKAIEINNWLNN